MTTQFGLYPRFYVKRKDLLLPLIETYGGGSLKNKNHGQVLKLYIELLRSNAAFKSEVDALIAANESKLLNAREKKELKSSSTKRNAIGATIVAGIGSVLDIFSSRADAKAASDEAFYSIVLDEQKKSDTTKILVASGIGLAFVGIAVYFAIKMKK